MQDMTAKLLGIILNDADTSAAAAAAATAAAASLVITIP
jgi:hypothetical protein